ncbi:MAG: DNA-binding transcriptional MerR regulator [Kiritimatiellia bacterium]
MGYRIKTVSELTGIPRHTLLAWHRRYDLIEPDRTDAGHRVYSDSDVATLVRVKEMLDQGLRIGEAVEFLQGRASETPVATDHPVRVILLAALLDYDRPLAAAHLKRLAHMSFQSQLDDVLSPLLQELGDGWHDGLISVSQEHFASAFVREAMIAMLANLDHGPKGGPVVLSAGIPGEPHELGMLSTAIKLTLRGYRQLYVGLNLPIKELALLAERQSAKLVCQSGILMPPEEIEAHAIQLRKLLPPWTTLAIGGPKVSGLSKRDGIWWCPTFEELSARL